MRKRREGELKVIVREVVDSYREICPRQIEVYDEMTEIMERGGSEGVWQTMAAVNQGNEADLCWKRTKIWLARLGRGATVRMPKKAKNCECVCPADICGLCEAVLIRPLVMRSIDRVDPVLIGLLFGASVRDIDIYDDAGLIIEEEFMQKRMKYGR